MSAEEHLAAARRYLEAIEGGATGDSLAAFFSADVVQREYPNRLVPGGATRDLAAILAGAERGQKVLRGQRYTIRKALASGDEVALEVDWEGTLAIGVGQLAPGDVMRASFAVFLTYEDGRIARQHNYDCFDAF